MNGALLSSQKMDYCTPGEFFRELDKEFHFALDAAATEKSAKCATYYTPETDGLTKPWNVAGGGVLCSAIHRMDERLESGSGRLTRRHKAGSLLCCSFRQEQTQAIFTSTSTGRRRSAGCEDGCGSRTKMGQSTRRHRFLQWSWSTTEREKRDEG